MGSRFHEAGPRGPAFSLLLSLTLTAAVGALVLGFLSFGRNAEAVEEDDSPGSSALEIVEFTNPPRPLFLERRRPSSNGGFQVSYHPDPDPIPRNVSFDLMLSIEESGVGVEPSSVDLSIWAEMPAHNHGMVVEPVTEALGKGRFRVDGMLFHMAGHWRLHVDLTRSGVTERAWYDLEVE